MLSKKKTCTAVHLLRWPLVPGPESVSVMSVHSADWRVSCQCWSLGDTNKWVHSVVPPCWILCQWQLDFRDHLLSASEQRWAVRAVEEVSIKTFVDLLMWFTYVNRVTLKEVRTKQSIVRWLLFLSSFFFWLLFLTFPLTDQPPSLYCNRSARLRIVCCPFKQLYQARTRCTAGGADVRGKRPRVPTSTRDYSIERQMGREGLSVPSD